MKNWIIGALKSWTIWFNTVMSTVFVFVAFALPQIQAALPLLQGSIPQTWYAIMLIVTLAGNIGFRFKTDTALNYK